MGVRTQAAQPWPGPGAYGARARSAGPGVAAALVVLALAFLLLAANGRPIGDAAPVGAAAWLRDAVLALAGRALELDATGRAIAGKLLAAACGALAGVFVFSAVTRRHGSSEGRWAAFALVAGTTLTAAAQSFSGEAPAACAVALAVALAVKADLDDEAGTAAAAGLPLALAVAFQPTTVALAAVLAGGLVLRWPRAAPRLLLWAVPGAVAALAATPLAALAPSRTATPAGALLVSPAKGALVFAPVALLGLLGVVRAATVRRGRFWDDPRAAPSRFLPITCGLACLAHVAALAVVGGWDTGVFWGPRLMAPAWPVLLVFLPEGLRLLGVVGSLLVLLSVGVQALGVLSYDGRWDRLRRGAKGELGAAVWDVEQSPIAFQLREGVARPALVTVANRRLVLRERALVGARWSASFVSFRGGQVQPTGADPTMEAFRIENGALVVGDRLELRQPGDGAAFRIREGALLRHLELRMIGDGTGAIGIGRRGRSETRWREQRVSGSFRLELPYHYDVASGDSEIVVSLRAGGPVRLASIALVPPGEPERVLRLP